MNEVADPGLGPAWRQDRDNPGIFIGPKGGKVIHESAFPASIRKFRGRPWTALLAGDKPLTDMRNRTRYFTSAKVAAHELTVAQRREEGCLSIVPFLKRFGESS